MRLIVLLGIILVATSCQKQEEFKFIEFRKYSSLKELQVETMQISRGEIVFLGTKGSFSSLSDHYQVPLYPYRSNQLGGEPNPYEKQGKPVDLQILIDTSAAVYFTYADTINWSKFDSVISVIQNSDFISDDYKTALRSGLLYQLYWQKTITCKALPVYIYNPTQAIASLPIEDGKVDLIQEARNENGQWQPIEYLSHSWCGNSYTEYILLPHYYFVVLTPRYYGEYKTQLRIKVKNGKKLYYSEPFAGSINRKQFDIPSDLIGKPDLLTN